MILHGKYCFRVMHAIQIYWATFKDEFYNGGANSIELCSYQQIVLHNQGGNTLLDFLLLSWIPDTHRVLLWFQFQFFVLLLSFISNSTHYIPIQFHAYIFVSGIEKSIQYNLNKYIFYKALMNGQITFLVMMVQGTRLQRGFGLNVFNLIETSSTICYIQQDLLSIHGLTST